MATSFQEQLAKLPQDSSIRIRTDQAERFTGNVRSIGAETASKIPALPSNLGSVHLTAKMVESIGPSNFDPSFNVHVLDSPDRNSVPRGKVDNSRRANRMSNPSREEFDAKLSVAEAKAETRFVELSGKLDRFLDNFQLTNQRIADVSSQIERTRSDLADFKSEISAIKVDNKNTRWTITITIVASVLTALGALWTTQSNLLSAFQTRIALTQAPITSPSK